MKALFLDHDGVICLPNQWGKRIHNSSDYDLYFDKFDQKAIRVLNKIIEKTNCEIIVSSDWRFHCRLESMQELYLKRGIIKKPAAYTSIKGINFPLNFNWDKKFELEQFRYFEIKNFLELNPIISKWVVIDDLDMRKNITNNKKEIIETRDWGFENFVWTNRFNEGIKQCGVYDKIIYYLSL